MIYKYYSCPAEHGLNNDIVKTLLAANVHMSAQVITGGDGIPLISGYSEAAGMLLWGVLLPLLQRTMAAGHRYA
jgi:hypothetical protein